MRARVDVVAIKSWMSSLRHWARVRIKESTSNATCDCDLILNILYIRHCRRRHQKAKHFHHHHHNKKKLMINGREIITNFMWRLRKRIFKKYFAIYHQGCMYNCSYFYTYICIMVFFIYCKYVPCSYIRMYTFLISYSFVCVLYIWWHEMWHFSICRSH